ncbi:hypothetical protein SAMN05216436_11485 [bacterium A37T11]|nr:hypothetical protein SAMN05216436_11485 [bacterium A37T11]
MARTKSWLLIHILKMSNSEISPSTAWKQWEIDIFRFTFLFIILLSFPLLDYKFYTTLFSTEINVRSILDLTKYLPQYITEIALPKWGIGSFANWGVSTIVAIILATVWRFYDKNKREYNKLYYWLRVIVRYRLAIGLIAYGFVKFFPLQVPYPSLSNLHTNYGDFYAWKIYYHTLGIVPKYESFLGFVEIAASVLLVFRKTSTIGAGIIIGFLGNVVIVNFAYDIGDHVYSSYLLLLALLVFAYDAPRLYSLLIKQQKTLANKYIPLLSSKTKHVRTILKVAFALFALTFGLLAFRNYTGNPYLLPKNPGLSGAYGFYDVKHFVFNGDTIPYSLTDPNRWQNVVFEKWSTLSLKIARPIKIDPTNGDEWHDNDLDRNYELAGTGGRHYFSYSADTVNHTLHLKNKNKYYKAEKLELSYSFPNDSTIILSGYTEKKDTIYALLERINKRYMLFEGRRKPVKL